MSTVLNTEGYRLFFFDNETESPPRVHVEKETKYAKFWLDPIAVVKSTGYTAEEIRQLRILVGMHRDLLEEKWHEWFSNP
jgi:hypothetical protein